MSAHDIQADWPSVTRFHVIDHTSGSETPGTILSRYGIKVKILMQDDNRTLKIVLQDREDGITEESVRDEMADGLARLMQDSLQPNQGKDGPWIS